MHSTFFYAETREGRREQEKAKPAHYKPGKTSAAGVRTTAARQTLVNAQSARGVNLKSAEKPLLPIEFGDLPKLFAPIEPVHYFQRKIFRPMG